MERLSQYQIFVLIIYYQLGTTILVGFASSAGRDAWISTLISMLLGLLIISIYLWLMQLNPGMDFLGWYQNQFGKHLGTFIAWQYPLMFIYYIGRIVVDVRLLIGNILLPMSPDWVITILFLLLICYVVSGGIEALGKLGEIIFPVLLLMFILEISLLLSTNIAKYDSIFPIAGEGWGRILEAIYPTGITQTFGQTLEFSFLWILAEDSKKVKRTTLLATLISGLTITLFDFLAICILGEGVFQKSIYPLYTLIQQIEVFEFLENLDVVGMLYISITMIFKCSIHLYILTKMFQKLTFAKSNRRFILPLSLVSYWVGATMANNSIEHYYISYKRFSQYLWVFTLFLYPTLLLVVTLIRKSHSNHKKTSNSSRKEESQ